MRPLIEILEDERSLMQRLESIHRFSLKSDDPDYINILRGKKIKVNRKLDLVHAEMRERITELNK